MEGNDMADGTNISDGDDPIPPHDPRPYGFMERELAFKLMASHAMVDAEYFARLRDEPVAAAAELHIALSERDLAYLTNDVDWARLEEMAAPVRESLVLENVTNSW
jgi:hypothetical protein